ncbi:MAG TPA: DUF4365 domain-containing protein [Pseudonocardiaceae bacterium]|nr:DUF4365 domain-containing protein [Pseudonocardiaceae bacterium]
MPLDPNQHQGLFGEAFIRVLAAAAGLTVARTDPDVTGDDFTLGYKGPLLGIRHPKFEVQVKSWRHSNAKRDDEFWRYRMERKHFNELAGDDFMLPRFLFLVIVPDHWPEYTTSDPGSLLVRHCAYWVSLVDRQRVDEDLPGRVPVSVPVRNVLATDTLLSLIADAARRKVGS